LIKYICFLKSFFEQFLSDFASEVFFAWWYNYP